MKVKTEATPAVQVFHEVEGDFRHRLIVVRGGVPVTSRWFGNCQLAILQKYRACYPGTNGEALPSGVFICSTIQHEVL